MFAVLGEIQFELANAPSAMVSEASVEYAELRVVQGQPRLQWLADGLESISLEMIFHAAVCDPQAQVQALQLAAQDHLARALVFGNGLFRGYFVVTGWRTEPRESLSDGTMVAIAARVTLKEWPLAGLLDPGAALRTSLPPVGLIAATGSATAAPGTAPVSPSASAQGVSALTMNSPSAAAPSAAAMPGDMAIAAIVRDASDEG